MSTITISLKGNWLHIEDKSIEFASDELAEQFLLKLIQGEL